jgi:hypothetical protein
LLVEELDGRELGAEEGGKRCRQGGSARSLYSWTIRVSLGGT